MHTIGELVNFAENNPEMLETYPDHTLQGVEHLHGRPIVIDAGVFYSYEPPKDNTYPAESELGVNRSGVGTGSFDRIALLESSEGRRQPYLYMKDLSFPGVSHATPLFGSNLLQVIDVNDQLAGDRNIQEIESCVNQKPCDLLALSGLYRNLRPSTILDYGVLTAHIRSLTSPSELCSSVAADTYYDFNEVTVGGAANGTLVSVEDTMQIHVVDYYGVTVLRFIQVFFNDGNYLEKTIFLNKDFTGYTLPHVKSR